MITWILCFARKLFHGYCKWLIETVFLLENLFYLHRWAMIAHFKFFKRKFHFSLKNPIWKSMPTISSRTQQTQLKHQISIIDSSPINDCPSQSSAFQSKHRLCTQQTLKIESSHNTWTDLIDTFYRERKKSN